MFDYLSSLKDVWAGEGSYALDSPGLREYAEKIFDSLSYVSGIPPIVLPDRNGTFLMCYYIGGKLEVLVEVSTDGCTCGCRGNYWQTNGQTALNKDFLGYFKTLKVSGKDLTFDEYKVIMEEINNVK